jgi:hypothetical protein
VQHGVKVGDIYIRNSDGKVWRVKKIDHKRIVLESENGRRLTLTDIFGLGKHIEKKNQSPNSNHRCYFPLYFFSNLSQYPSMARLKISDAEKPNFLDMVFNRFNCKSDK